MLFTLTDVILVAIIIFFASLGLILGLIQAIGALIGMSVGVWSALTFYVPVAGWFEPYLIGNETAAQVIAFVTIFILTSRLVGLVFWLINKIFKLISLIPFLGSINRIGGFLLGLIEGVLISGISIYVIVRIAPDAVGLIDALDGSKIAHSLVWLIQFLTNLI